MIRQNTADRAAHETAQSLDVIFTRNKGLADFAPRTKQTVVDRNEVVQTRLSQETKRHELLDQSHDAANHRIARQESLNRPPLPQTIPNSTLLEHIATSRFFHHYVSPKRTFWRLDLDFTSSVIDDATNRSVLAEAVIALGILTLPTRTRASCLAAQCRYTRALRMTNQALADAQQSKLDETLMAVILLGLYEASLSSTATSLQANS